VTVLIQIPALGCNEQLYAKVNPLLPVDLDKKVIIPIADRMSGCAAQVLAQAPNQFILLGTSFGGRVAMELALVAPSRVKGLVIIGAGPGPVADQAGGLKRSARMRGSEFENVLTEMGDIISHLPGPHGVSTMNAFRDMSRVMGPSDMATQSDALAYREDLWPRMVELECPTLCLWGDHDQYSDTDVGRKIASVVKRGTFLELPNCGHFPTLEYPDASAAAIIHWLSISHLI
jgi:pimeloyl-ACP methyl ester carboxylesterase